MPNPERGITLSDLIWAMTGKEEETNVEARMVHDPMTELMPPDGESKP